MSEVFVYVLVLLTLIRISATQTANWKSVSEETTKTRNNAKRVIVSKFKSFWPAGEAIIVYSLDVCVFCATSRCSMR